MMIKNTKFNLVLFLALLFILGRGAFAQEEGKKGQVPPADQKQAEKTPAAPAINIKPTQNQKEQLYSVELRDVQIRDLFRVLAQDYKLNLLIDNDVDGTITASFNNISLEDMLDAIAQSNNLVLNKEKNIIKIKPNLITKVFVLNHIEAKKIVQAQQAGQAAAPTGGAGQAAPQAQSGSVNTIFDLLSPKGKILLGEQPNSIMIIDYPTNMERIEEYLKIVDQKMMARVYKLKYISVMDLFPELLTKDRTERQQQRSERAAETDELKSMQPTATTSGTGQ
jgi:type II secretory pathway component GspD/PulD (secretin)